MRTTLAALLVSVLLGAPSSVRVAADPFTENVRPTDPIPAAEQAKRFHLPPGFEIQLVAAEPDIGKPFNIAFDAKGRLWVTCSHAYPFPAKDGKDPLDRILILDDFDPATGRARKITTFADNLNIPIGIYPLPSCDGCIVYSIPNIVLMKDTDGDGKADTSDVLVGPFGYDRDTHGMASNFRRGFDGWIYACHGFNNVTHARAKDGSTIDLNSGNTFRFKIDGSHVEQYTWGQTNPFGLAFDELGNLYSSDSHSKPFYQLIRGGYYEGIGKKEDGLGFAPRMMDHLHNSTAIASTFYYADDKWPAEYRGNLFCGNVVTSRINRDTLTFTGSTPKANEQPDFLTTEDPWFRPVNLVLGPDGQMWVADFYNKIIGHYEVPLTHPARDHDHGRIWRIVYKGDAAVAPAAWKEDLTHATTKELANTLKSSCLPLRMLATDQLSDRQGAATELQKEVIFNPQATQVVHDLWVAFRRGAPGLQTAALAGSVSDRVVRVHAMRLLAQIPLWTDTIAGPQGPPARALVEKDPWLQRAAAEAISLHPEADCIRPLLDLLEHVPSEDTHLAYTVKVAIREHLKPAGSFAKLPKLDPADARAIADIALAVPTEESGAYVARFIADPANNAADAAPLVRHALRYAPAADAAALLASVRTRFNGKLDTQAGMLKAVVDASQERGVPLDADTKKWAVDVANQLIATPAKQPKATVTRQQQAADIAKAIKDPALAPAFEKLLQDPKADAAVRASAAQVLAALGDAHLATLVTLATDDAAPINLREGCIDVVATRPPYREKLIESLRQSPARLQLHLALGLAADKDGGERLFAAVQKGQISPRALQNPFTPARLKQSGVPDVEPRIAALTKGIGSVDAELQRLIDERAKGYAKAKHDLAAGERVFQQTCVACHQIDGKGAVVGPQLDGVGNRGLDRLLEDVLDPNRAVDPAFHAWTIKLNDGTDLSAIVRREEGETLVIADPTGKELAIPKANIESRKESNLSLMPTNFGEVLPEQSFYDLLAYLLSKNAGKK